MQRGIASDSAVVGAGFAGLVATAFAKRPTDLFESLCIPGGRARISKLNSPILPDLGPSFVHGNNLHEMVMSAGIDRGALLDLEQLSFWTCDKSGRKRQVAFGDSPLHAMGVLQNLMRESQSNILAAELLGR